MFLRIGNGLDVHQLQNGIPLIIGGVSIPNNKGSKGHSDGDVLFHAIVDALFGSLALGDLGKHFPSSDNRWKGANSKTFLEYAFKLVKEKGFTINNLDSVVMLQKPILTPYIQQMRENITRILSIKIDQVSVKATTTDMLGFIGKGEGIAATATVLITNEY